VGVSSRNFARSRKAKTGRTPEPMLKPRVPTTFDHECEITLAIHAAIPTSLETPIVLAALPYGPSETITAAEAPLQIERPIR
jgi:hypothetical protein